MADVENPIITEVGANNIAPPPDGLPALSSPNAVYPDWRELAAMSKRWWNRVNPTVTSGGSANVQTLTFGVAPTQGYVLGQTYAFIAGFANTGAMTINVNGLGAKNVQANGAALVGGELKVGLIVEIAYDGTQFQIIGGSGAGSGAYLPLACGTLTGNLTITGAAASAIVLNTPTTTPFLRAINAQTAGLNRWQMIFANAASEGGSNAGSDFAINRYNDAGTLVDVPLSITRSSGLVTLSQNLVVSAGNININTASSANFIMNKAASGQNAAIFGRTNGANRWLVMLGESTAEGGSNAGSNFIIQSWNDAGSAALANPLSIVRSTGVCTFSAAIVNGPSDRTLKENITPLDGALDKVKALQGVSFNFIATPEKREIGLVAQDVEAIVPEVIQEFTATDAEGKQAEPKLALDYPKLTALLIEALKILTTKVEKLEARLPLAPETA